MKNILIVSLFLSSCFSKPNQEISHIFKNVIRNHPIAFKPNNPNLRLLVQAAETDLHYFTRFLKELTSYPCLLISDTSVDNRIIQQLFPGVNVQIVSNGTEAFVQGILDEFVQAQEGYCVVLTNIDSGRLTLRAPQSHALCMLVVNDIVAASHGKIPHRIDMQKMFRLMRRRIHVVCTAALIPIKYEERKAQYCRALGRVCELGYHPYVIESCVQGPTFLDDLSKHILYSMTNDESLRNKGVNEFKSMLYAFNNWKFRDDDIIVKLTGRYFFQTDAFIRFLEEADDIDCAAKFVTVPVTKVDAVLTGCFAMRFGLFKQMLAFFDYDELERNMICVEHVVGPYLNNLVKKGIKVARRQKLDIEANMFYTHGSPEISYW